MSAYTPGTMTAQDYDRAAQEYLASLPLEHFMEATPQATQREITLASLALLKRRRGDLQYFSELLVQYFFHGNLRQVVPDNMLVRSTQPEVERTNFALELELDPPFMALEYVSPNNPRKDYKDNLKRYERELKIPYYVLFYPEKQDLRVYRHDGERYLWLEPDASGRFSIPELDLQIGLLHRWVRFWHQKDLLELPAELAERLEGLTVRLRITTEQLNERSKQLEAATLQLETTAKDRDQAQHERDRVKTEFDALAERMRQVFILQGQGIDALRSALEEKATRAGRQDLLKRLAATTDLALLGQWFVELP